ncbi:MAG: hypothetical protein HUJ16_06530 [Kangiella sp.]|nr:hypothetical protein [Kangiella sp.]
MSEIIDGNEGSGGSLILGDESSQQAISFKQAQAFYSEITGKSEKISERFTKSFILTIDNVVQLHHRIIQSTVQYNVASANASFSVDYQNDSSERFSSIERLQTHAGNKGVPVEEVDITYNFLIILPGTNKPQEYRINIQLISRIVKLEGIREQMGDMPFSLPLWQFDDKFTCRASIDFIDITVANSFMSVIKCWNSGLNEVDTNPVIKFIRPISKFFPAFCKYGLLGFGSYYTLSQVQLYFSEPKPETTATFILIALLFNFLLWKIGIFTGHRTQNHFNQLYEVSYIEFSGADKTFAKQCKITKRNNTFFSIGYVVSTLLIGVLASGVAGYIFN